MTFTPENAVKIEGCKEPGCPIWTPHTQHLGPNVVVSVSKSCPECGMTGGPYPNGDRQKHNPANGDIQSGCSSCGWCY